MNRKILAEGLTRRRLGEGMEARGRSEGSFRKRASLAASCREAAQLCGSHHGAEATSGRRQRDAFLSPALPRRMSRCPNVLGRVIPS